MAHSSPSLTGKQAVTCVACSSFWLLGARAGGQNNTPLGYCETCSIGLPAGYRPSYRRYLATVAVQEWLNNAANRSWQRLGECVDYVNHVSDNILSRADRLAARHEMLTHHRAVSCSTLWLTMPFELFVYETYTSVNTPLPAEIMEFFNRGE